MHYDLPVMFTMLRYLFVKPQQFREAEPFQHVLLAILRAIQGTILTLSHKGKRRMKELIHS